MKRSLSLAAFSAFMAVSVHPAASQSGGVDPQDGAALCASAKIFIDAHRGAAFKSGAPGVSRSTPGFDAVHYDLDLDMDASRSPILRGVVTITGRVSETLSSVGVDLDDNMTVRSVRSTAGDPLEFLHSDDMLSVELSAAAVPGEPVAFTVEYEGNPESGGFGVFEHGFVSGNPYIWTLSEPYGASHWWPNVDHPSDKADSVRIAVRVPEPLRAGSNGILTGETRHGDGTVTYEWRHRYPISSYLVSLAIGVYDVYEQTYVRPDTLANAYGPGSLPILHYAYAGTNLFQGIGDQFGWNHVVEILPIFEHWFGPYPFQTEKYGHAATTFGGGMEHQTMTSMGGSGWGLVAHELAHMWYGDMITNRTWPHLWLHEGFATMGELLFWEGQTGYESVHATIFDLYYDRALQAEGTLVVADTMDIGNLFAHARVYSKGGMVLHMLRGVLGDDVFQAVLRAWSADGAVRFGTAVSDDFERVASDVSGKDLSVFFDQWVTNGTGYPTYELSWIPTADETGPAVLLEIRQTQQLAQSNVSAFQMPVHVRVDTADGPRAFVVENDRRTQSWVLSLDSQPTRVVLDPERKVLRSPDVGVTLLPPPSAFEWSLFPNPAGARLHVRLDLPAPTNVDARLVDASGRLVRTFDLGSFGAGSFIRELELPPGIVSGMYIVEIATLDGVSSRTVVLIR